MSFPNLLEGKRFRLCRGDGNTPEAFIFVCTATTLKLDEKGEYDDSMLIDCDDPDSDPERVSTTKGRTWDVTFSGKCDHQRYLTLRRDLNTRRNWQLFISLSASAGGGAYQGPAFLDSLSMSKSENGLVTFDASLKGQETLDWIPAT